MPKKKIKLAYEPSGVIVRFEFNNIIVFSDTTSILTEHTFDSLHLARTRYLIQHKVYKSKKDTIFFDKDIRYAGINGYVIHYVDSVDEIQSMHISVKWLFWEIEEQIALLTDQDRTQILNKSGQPVRMIKTKKFRYGIKGVKGAYMDKETQQRLFVKVVRYARVY